MNVSLKFEKDKELGLLVGYIDLDFTSELDQRHLSAGYIYSC